MDSIDGSLEFGEAEAGAEAFVKPAGTGEVLAREHDFVGFDAIFKGPNRIPELGAGGGNHAAFAGGGDEHALTAAPGSHITEAAHGRAGGRQRAAGDGDSVDTVSIELAEGGGKHG